VDNLNKAVGKFAPCAVLLVEKTKKTFSFLGFHVCSLQFAKHEESKKARNSISFALPDLSYCPPARCDALLLPLALLQPEPRDGQQRFCVDL
jgi:hypothetical protein